MGRKIENAKAAIVLAAAGALVASTAITSGNVGVPDTTAKATVVKSETPRTTAKATHEPYANSCVLNGDDTVSIYGEGGRLQYQEPLKAAGMLDRRFNHAVAVSAHAMITKEYNMDRRAHQLSCDFTALNGTKRVAQPVIEQSSANMAAVALLSP